MIYEGNVPVIVGLGHGLFLIAYCRESLAGEIVPVQCGAKLLSALALPTVRARSAGYRQRLLKPFTHAHRCLQCLRTVGRHQDPSVAVRRCSKHTGQQPSAMSPSTQLYVWLDILRSTALSAVRL